MKDLITKYLAIVKIELEDLEEDIISLIELTEERILNREITNYVGMENETVLRAEFEGIRSVVKSIETFNVSKYNDLQEFIDDLKEQLREKIDHSGFPNAVYLFVERKLKKVARYIRDEQET